MRLEGARSLKTSTSGPRTICTAVVTAILAGCGSVQPSIIPRAPQQSAALAPGSGYRVIYRFQNNAQDKFDGANPFARLYSTNGALYGTTFNGGAHAAGTVFSVTMDGTENILYDFRGGRDGANPEAGLIGVDGVLYGTTATGGAKCYPNGCGTVFSLTIGGTEKVLYRFRGGSDGAAPFASLINVNGTLYGTTVAGGRGCYPSGCGTIFSVTPTGTEKVLHAFAGGADGESPQAGLIAVNGVLYGATGGGGTHGKGTIFSATTSGAEKVMYSFGGGSDGWAPVSSLIDIHGTLFGTTAYGGGAHCYNNYGCGTIFSVTTSGTEKAFYRFRGARDGANPVASLIDVNGMLYGTTENGGSNSYCREPNTGCGTVFSLTTTGTEKVLHSFAGNSDGALPFGSLIIMDGTLYGTTQQGGGGSAGCHSCGTVFALNP